MKIVLKASDPSSCAPFLRALGAILTPSGTTGDQADGDRTWRGRVVVDLELSGDPAASGLEVRFDAADGSTSASCLIDVGAAIEFSSPGMSLPYMRLVGPTGDVATMYERRGAAPPEAPIRDRATFPHVSGWLYRNLEELRGILAKARAANPRILGPESLGGTRGHDFTLIVDGDADTDLAMIDGFLARVRTGPLGVRARLASSLPENARATLDAIAFRPPA